MSPQAQLMAALAKGPSLRKVERPPVDKSMAEAKLKQSIGIPVKLRKVEPPVDKSLEKAKLHTQIQTVDFRSNLRSSGSEPSVTRKPEDSSPRQVDFRNTLKSSSPRPSTPAPAEAKSPVVDFRSNLKASPRGTPSPASSAEPKQVDFRSNLKPANA
mmetsp:Transcript_16154/g.41487  ORF Transcript_16154/g.41487 Transcript_16154/m.41487 type:complete len:157 (-) Transcript_16154:101-571(-)